MPGIPAAAGMPAPRRPGASHGRGYHDRVRADDVATALGEVVAGLPGGGEVRDGQLAMAEAVARAFAEERHLVVRAGTGTGKSLGYLVPAVLAGKRVVVATATKALQDQLASKDLPLVFAGTRRRPSFAVLKGRSNYLCVQRLRESEVAGTQGSLGEEEAGGAKLGEEARRVVEWARRTTTGDRAELEIEPDPRLWASFSVAADECPGAFRCPSGGECFAEAARNRAASADVVVVNLHLLGADLASDGAVLPEHDALIVDEAHELEDVLTASLGCSIGAGRVRALAATARAALGGSTRRRRSGAGADGDGAVDQVMEAADRLERALGERAGERLRGGALGELGEAVTLLVGRIERLEAELHRAAGGAKAEGAEGASGERGQRLTRALLVAGRLREQLGTLAELGDDEVAWVEGGARPTLEVAPVDVAPVLKEKVFGERPVVLTSATVPPGLAARLGADQAQTEELDVGSPFAYQEQALLYCAAHLPDRRRPDAEAAIHDELAALVDAAGGRTLALFTSRAAMERAAQAMRQRLDWPILAQGDASKAALLEAFAAEAGACLFATMGFWQGVDVPGATLALVVIDRIPFPRPDDPLMAARRERAGPSAFRTIDLPRAASLLAQGAGRLVRSADDRGVVAVLDSRLATATYRWDLVRALPPMRRTKERAEAEAFLRTIHRDASQAERAARPSGRKARPLSSRAAR